MGKWIKIETHTPDKAEIRHIARLCDCTKADAFLAFFRVFVWLDELTTTCARDHSLRGRAWVRSCMLKMDGMVRERKQRSCGSHTEALCQSHVRGCLFNDGLDCLSVPG